jgi:hypothetical protein
MVVRWSSRLCHDRSEPHPSFIGFPCGAPLGHRYREVAGGLVDGGGSIDLVMPMSAASLSSWSVTFVKATRHLCFPTPGDVLGIVVRPSSWPHLWVHSPPHLN